MFAAKAGAEHVYGIDMSGIVEQAKTIVERNGLADKVRDTFTGIDFSSKCCLSWPRVQ